MNVERTSNGDVLASLDSLTGEEALYAVLKAKGWPHRSSMQIAGIRRIAHRRKLGNDHTVAAIIRDHHPGRDHADLFAWCERVPKPSRPMRILADIKEPDPRDFYTDEELAAAGLGRSA